MINSYASLNDRWVGKLRYWMSAECVDLNTGPALRSQASMQESSIYFPPPHRSLEPHLLWSVHILDWSSRSRSTVFISLRVQKDFSLLHTVPLDPEQRKQKRKRSSSLRGLDPFQLYWTHNRDLWVACSVVLRSLYVHVSHVCVGVFRRVAGTSSDTHQLIIAHNCIHLWKKTQMNISGLCHTCWHVSVHCLKINKTDSCGRLMECCVNSGGMCWLLW